MKKTLKAVLSVLSAAAVTTIAGCSGTTSTSSVPIISINVPEQSERPAHSEGSEAPIGAPESGTSGNDEPIGGSSSGDTPAPPEIKPNEQGGEMSGNIFVCADGRGIVLFGGDSGGGPVYAAALSEVKEKVGPYVNVYSMIVPTMGSFYMPAGFEMMMASEWDVIQNVNSMMTGVRPIDVYSVLAEHTDEEIFARTDHHWMQLGAYYAAEAFVKDALITEPFAPLEDYEKREVPNYLGTLYAYSEYNAVMGENPETFVYYISPNDFSTYYLDPQNTDFYQSSMFVTQPANQSYSTFMGGDNKVVHVKTDVRNNRKLLIVKDSYANALVPCLTGSFEEIITVDMRYLKNMEHFPQSISQIVKDYDISDVLFCMDSFSAVGENALNLPDIT